MGILREPAAFVEKLHLAPGFSVCELGDQWLTYTDPHLLAEKFYQRMGCGRYVSIDGNGRATLTHDLNLPVPKELLGQFDLVTDFGTGEHVFDQAQIWRTLHDLAKPGGYIVFDRPTQGYEGHCFFNAQESLFRDIAAANSYEVLRLERRMMSRGELVRGVFRKLTSARFETPQQGRYRKLLRPIAAGHGSSKPLTVACLYVRGHVPFTVDYVRRLHTMVGRHVDRAFRFVCFTDRPEEMPIGVEPIVVEAFPNCFAWWTKLELFNRAHRLNGRVLFLDLDVLIVASLKPIIDLAASFGLVPDGAPDFQGQGKRKVVKRFNSSVMIFDAPGRVKLHSEWTPAIAQRLWGDQDWIGERFPDEVKMPIEWFPRLSAMRLTAAAKPIWPAEAIVVLSKKPKNADAAKLYPWFDQAWGGS